MLCFIMQVGKSDINKIVNGIVYVSSLLKNENGKMKSDGMEGAEKQEMDFLQDNHESSSEEEEEESMVACEEQERRAKQEEELPTTNVVRGGAVHKCPTAACAVRAHTSEALAYHVTCHVTAGPGFRCQVCGENVAQWRALQTHLWRAHQVDTELYRCEQCPYRTHSLAKLNNVHRLIHGEERPFLCDHCGKGFKNPKQLRNHRAQVHRPALAQALECTACRRQFGTARQLRAHRQAVHERLRPWVCAHDHCTYRAASRSQLTMHERQHTGERPYRCEQCDYTTADHNSLRRHKLRHSGLKKYRCELCSYACIQSSTYKAHLRSKHPAVEGGAVHACPAAACSFRSLSEDRCRAHVAQRHPQQHVV